MVRVLSTDTVSIWFYTLHLQIYATIAYILEEYGPYYYTLYV